MYSGVINPSGHYSIDCSSSIYFWEHPGDHNHQDFPRSTAIQMGGVLQYNWEAYCNTNARSAGNISFSSERRDTESTAMQIGGVLQYKLEVYFLILFWVVVLVGVSDNLLIFIWELCQQPVARDVPHCKRCWELYLTHRMDADDLSATKDDHRLCLQRKKFLRKGVLAYR